jgi:hypothetical protein
MRLRLAGIFPRSRPRRTLWAGTPTGVRAMAIDSRMIAAVAELVVKRRYRRQLDEGDPDPLAADVQALYDDPTAKQEATLVLAHLLFVRRELGEDAVRQVRDRHAMAGSRR